MTLHALLADLRSGALTSRALTAQCLERIAARDPQLNAFLALAPDALEQAEARDRASDKTAPLHGLPIAIKDLTDTAGLTTTYGSWLYKDHVPQEDDLIVARLRAAGAVIIGKTMTPEFGFGALCTNRLKGPTANPYDLTRTSGGSSGGAAAAVAAGLVPVAHGTDFGGSVRTPAGFCGLASLRPTPGLLPAPKRGLGLDMLATTGFLARCVDDLVLVTAAVAGPHPDDPLSLGLHYGEEPDLSDAPLRLAVSPDLGVAPVTREVRGLFTKVCQRLAGVAAVDEAHPDCSDAIATFHALRPSLIRHSYGPLLARHGEDLTDTVRWWIERGAGVLAEDFLAAEARRTALFRRFMAFLSRYDALVLPAAPLQPWPNSQPEVMMIDEQPMATRMDYLAITFVISLTGCPVVTLPTGQDENRLPFGVQVVGRPGEDARLIAVCRRLEAEAGFRFVPPPQAV